MYDKVNIRYSHEVNNGYYSMVSCLIAVFEPERNVFYACQPLMNDGFDQRKQALKNNTYANANLHQRQPGINYRMINVYICIYKCTYIYIPV